MKPLLKYIKNILLGRFGVWFIGRIVYCYYQLVLITSNIEIIYENNEFHDLENKPVLFALWHNRIFAFLNGKFPTKLPVTVLVSSHKDGKLIASCANKAIEIIHGSTNRNAHFALRKILRAIKASKSIAITPDGPRGPACTINSNIIGIAKLCQIPIIPISYSASKTKIFNSWDRFILPKPFCNICIIFGTPIYISKSDDEDKKQEYLRKSLNQITKKADIIVA